MTREELIENAAKLPKPSPEAAREYDSVRERAADAVTGELARRDDLEALIGKGNSEMMSQNHRNHALFMSSMFAGYAPRVFVETILWVFRAYRSHGFGLTYWPAQLDSWLSVLGDLMGEQAFGEIKPFYEWMLVNQAAFANLSDACLGESHVEH